MGLDPAYPLLLLKVAIFYGALVLWWAQRGRLSEARRAASVAVTLMLSALWLALLVIAVPAVVTLVER